MNAPTTTSQNINNKGRIKFRNRPNYNGPIDSIDLDPSTKRKISIGISLDDEGYLTRTNSQVDDDSYSQAHKPGRMGNVIIQQESQKLSDRLQWLSDEEIGIMNMQVCSHNLTK